MSAIIDFCSEEPPCDFSENPGKYLHWMIGLNVQKMKADIARKDEGYLSEAYCRWLNVAGQMADLSFMQKKEIANLVGHYLDRVACYAKALKYLLNEQDDTRHIEKSITIAEHHLNAVILKLQSVVQYELDSNKILARLLDELFKSFSFIVTYRMWAQHRPELAKLHERLVTLDEKIRCYIATACRVNGMINAVTVRKQRLREFRGKREWRQYMQLIEQFKKEIARFMSHAGGSCYISHADTPFPRFYKELHSLYWHSLVPKCKEAYKEQKRDENKQKRHERYLKEKRRKQEIAECEAAERQFENEWRREVEEAMAFSEDL